MKHRVTGFLFASMMALAPMAAYADDLDEARSRGGVSIGADGTYFRENHAVDNGWYGGANLRFHLGPALALEGAVDYRKDSGIDFYPAQGSLIIYLAPGYQLSPYLVGGGTWYFADGSGVSDSRFGPHAGAGLELFLTRYLSIDASWRHLWVEDLATGDSYFNRSYSGNGDLFRGGVNFHF